MAQTNIEIFQLLEAAIKEGNIDKFKNSFPSLSDIHYQNAKGSTLVLIAAYWGQVAILQFLIENGGAEDVSKTHPDSATPAFVAAQEGHPKALQLLAGHHADLNQETLIDGIRTTPAFIAAYKGHHEVLQVLAEWGADLSKPRATGATPAFAAAQNGHVNALQLLAEHGADLDQAITERDGKGVTPSYVAAQEGHADALQVLAEWGADLSKPRATGTTPVFMAAQNGYVEALRVLAEHGADLDEQIPRQGGSRTPLEEAEQKGHKDASAFIRQWIEAKENIKTFHGLLKPLKREMNQGLKDYLEARKEAISVIGKLQRLALDFYTSPQTSEGFITFKMACVTALAPEHTTKLRSHRSLFDLLCAFVTNFLVTLKKTFFCENTTHLYFFDGRTEAAKTLDALKEDIGGLPCGTRPYELRV